MARTQRTKRPRFRLGEPLSHKQHPDGTVRDGTQTHPAASCQHHGGCTHCEGDRLYSRTKREISADEQIEEEGK